MARRLKKYFFILQISISDAMVYAVDFLGRSFFFAFIIAIYLFLWKAIYSNGKATLDGFDLQKMIWYLIVTEIISLSNSRIYSEVSSDVKSGNIAYLLNKPYHYVGYCFSNAIGKIGIALIINSIIGLFIGTLFVGPLRGFHFVTLPLIVLSIIFGVCIDFFISFALALTAFWVEENMPFRWIYQKLVFTLGGMLLPLDLFPKAIKDISTKLPFAYVTYGPAKLAVDFEGWRYLQIFSMQVLYLILAIGLCLWVYRKGVKTLNVNGG